MKKGKAAWVYYFMLSAAPIVECLLFLIPQHYLIAVANRSFNFSPLMYLVIVFSSLLSFALIGLTIYFSPKFCKQLAYKVIVVAWLFVSVLYIFLDYNTRYIGILFLINMWDSFDMVLSTILPFPGFPAALIIGVYSVLLFAYLKPTQQ